VRRAMVPVLGALIVSCVPLCAQSAFTIGYDGTLGSNWQIEALEAGLVGHTGLGPVRYLSGTVRIGWFGDQGAIIGGTRGFIGAGALALRSGRIRVFAVGEDQNPTVVALDLSLEAAGYLAAHAPSPWVARSVSLAVLPGIRVGQAGGGQFVVLGGPAWFSGGGTWHAHAFLSARYEVPLGERH
jgi:hypothetical protein